MVHLILNSVMVLLTILKVFLIAYTVTVVVSYIVGVIFSSLGIKTLGVKLKQFSINQVNRTLKAFKIKG